MNEHPSTSSAQHARSTHAVASRYALLEEEIDEERLYAPRSPSSVRRYLPGQSASSPIPARTHIQVTRHAIPPRATAQRMFAQEPPLPRTRPARQQRAAPRLHWLTGVGLGMLVMLVGWILLSVLLAWWHGAQDDWQYGRPAPFRSMPWSGTTIRPRTPATSSPNTWGTIIT